MSKYIDFVLARFYLIILGLMVMVVGIISPGNAMARLKVAVEDMDART